MIAENKIIGIFPVKENSERLPGKNFKHIGPFPLWAYALKALLKSGVCDEIIIDTDVPNKFEKAKLPPLVKVETRRDVARGDDVPMNKVIESVVGRHPADYYIQIHATSPFLTPETIKMALDACIGKHDSVYTVTERRSRFWTANQEPVNHSHKVLEKTQDLPPLYEENSAVYVFSGEAFDGEKNRICGDSLQLEISALDGFDIDYQDDFEMALLMWFGRGVLEGQDLPNNILET